uniref:PUM-HD domain-containing protein n=1 Tax=Globodera pallida TaxID=36090 RepID=A0A183BQW1_GLOPA
MINRFIRNFLNAQHIICKVQHVQTVRGAFLHQCAKNVCPAALISCGARMASSSSSKYRPSHRSKLLDAYHKNRTANPQLADLGEHVVAFALDQQGSRFIEQKLERANPTEKAQLVDALRGHVLELAQQMYGCHVIGAALKSVDKASQIEIINEILAQVIPLSLHKYGSLVIRFVLEHCTHKRLVLEQLHANMPTLVMDKYGSHVIERVIEHGLPEDRARIVRILQGDIMKYALDKFGSHIMRKCFAFGTADQKKALFDNVCGGGPKTLQNARQLMADELGTHVIRSRVGTTARECAHADRARIVRSLQGGIMKNTHLHSFCDVINKCLIFGTTDQKNALIDQVCADDGTGKPPLLQMMKQQFANDVVLKMVDGADTAHRNKMMCAIEEHIPALLKRQQSLKEKGGRRNR